MIISEERYKELEKMLFFLSAFYLVEKGLEKDHEKRIEALLKEAAEWKYMARESALRNDEVKRKYWVEQEYIDDLQNQVKDLISSEVTADAEIERLREQIRVLEESRSRVQAANRNQMNNILTLYAAIEHGDEEHKKWLKDKITTHFRLMGVQNETR